MSELLEKASNELLAILSSLGITFLISIVTYFAWRLILNKSDEQTKRNVSKLIKPIALIVWSVILYLTITSEAIEDPVLSHVNIIVFILGISWLMIVLVENIRDKILGKYDIQAKDNLKARQIYTQIKVFERIAIVVIVVIAIGLILMTFDGIREVGISILSSAGIVGIVFGLGAQRLISNILAGFQIAVTQPIRLDDAVFVENEWGWIEEINLSYVVVKIWDQRRLVIPSNYFIEKPFQNWTRTTADLLGTVFLYLDYTVPLDELRGELTKILLNTDLWDMKVNIIQVTDSNDKTMEIRALVSAENSQNTWDLRVLVREKLIDFLQRKYPNTLPKSRVHLDRKNVK